ncbi:hypothetical protein SAMN05216257_102276 [Meinhardsimonia xiamenensis]|jgi:hypothetical protein|uniref:Uncharacterized protein n=1 Tax=Meinhardsimonia xiamenensis TaxID=990712 RepID=A0A1G9ATZ1_9RHOB|nr:hypothetical protein [Meinhardsimonia xiamenensis]PRX35248.1 hypothetical protein LV81_01843 [Meinhardsimonia xiamenensis]SDK30727.1 hypothetical protein SAMN05216257_102276 [Meinhardsimonia xiamenensis]
METTPDFVITRADDRHRDDMELIGTTAPARFGARAAGAPA